MLIVLLAVDAALIATHAALHFAGSPLEDAFDIGKDRRAPEFWQYAKLMAIIGLAARIAWTQRCGAVWLWSALFVYLLAEDSLAIHEAIGAAFGAWRGGAAILGLSPVAFGELLAPLAVAGLILPALFVAHLRGSAEFRLLNLVMVGLLGCLGFFGVVVDFVHAAFAHGYLVDKVLLVIEDGGEMATISAMAAALYALGRAGGPASILAAFPVARRLVAGRAAAT